MMRETCIVDSKAKLLRLQWVVPAALTKDGGCRSGGERMLYQPELQPAVANVGNED
jgi:hypothetical protein